MKLFYAPGACSLAPHIVICEGGLDVVLDQVTFGEKRTTQDGRDFFSLNPMGAVPALELASGDVLTENQVLMQYLAELKPAAKLGPPASGIERWRFLETLNFIATELHKGFNPIYASPPSDFKTTLMEKLTGRFKLLDQKLGSQPFLTGDHFTIADAYAFTMVNWAQRFGVTVSDNLKAYYDRLKARPGVQKALTEEGLPLS